MQGYNVIIFYHIYTSGALDFSVPITSYFMGMGSEAIIDVCVNLTGFSLVGGPASQDAKKAKEVLTVPNRPYKYINR